MAKSRWDIGTSAIDQAIFDASLTDPASGAAIRAQRSMLRIISILLLVSVGVSVGAVVCPRVAEHSRRSRLVAWAQEFRSDTSQEMAKKFDECARLEVEEAIPFAALTAVRPAEKDGQTQWHVISARRFLRDYDFEKIENDIQKAMRGDPRNTPGFIVALRKVVQ